MYEHVLVPFDGEPAGWLAVARAADLARRYQCRLTLLHVIPPQAAPLVLTEGPGCSFDYRAECERLLLRGLLLDLAERAARYHATQTVCVEADGRTVPQAIADQVSRERADLIVMGTRARSGRALGWPQGVADAAARQVRIPVFLVPAPAQARGRPLGRSRVTS